MKEEVSSLMDGEFNSDQTDNLIKRIERDEEARETWAAYHLIGDVIRGDGIYREGIQNRIFNKLASEPVVLAPKPRAPIPSKISRVGMAVAASVVTLSMVAWLSKQQITQPAPVALAQDTPQIAATQISEPVVAPFAVQQANLNEYLSAHEEFLRSTAGYRRVATSINTVAPSSGTPEQ
ncbi:MAG: sigma-E factor negative regulatory protein [Pseudomonadota bacterium]